MKSIRNAWTFDDILCVPRSSGVLPKDIVLSSKFSRNVPLRIPISSAAMDTVTDPCMAIAVAECGGIGVIHRNMTVAEQAAGVRRVKRHRSGIILNPYTLHQSDTIEHARQYMRELGVSGLLIVDGSRKLLGILTRRDVQGAAEHDRVGKHMTPQNDLIVGNPHISLPEAEKKMWENRIEKLPLVEDDFILAGLITLKDTKKGILFPDANVDSKGRLYIGAAVGVTGDFLERAEALVREGVDVIVIDTAHGDAECAHQALQRLKEIPGMVDIVAGNIATPEAAKRFLSEGADAVKVGFGPGSICTTRIVTGCGVPQFSAIYWIAEEIRKEIPVIGDGGIRFSGDLTKALVAGASSVMIGSLFAATDEAPGETIKFEGKEYKHYRGMGSEKVHTDRYGEGERIAEGVEGAVPSRGSCSHMIRQLIGGLRRGMEYLGCATVRDLDDVECVEITKAGGDESHAHDVMIREEPSNYPLFRR